MKDKRGIEDLLKNISVLILIIIFFAVMFPFVSRAGGGDSITEQSYAKQIATLIDKAKPGTSIDMDVSELYDAASKNKYSGDIVKIDNENKKVIVRVVDGSLYSYNFFNSANIIWNIKKDKGYEQLSFGVVSK